MMLEIYTAFVISCFNSPENAVQKFCIETATVETEFLYDLLEPKTPSRIFPFKDKRNYYHSKREGF